MLTTNHYEFSFSTPHPDEPAAGLGALCDLLDHLRAEVALLDAIGLPDVADQMAAYERLVRRLVYVAVSDLAASTA
jgi:hypothetical protein